MMKVIVMDNKMPDLLIFFPEICMCFHKKWQLLCVILHQHTIFHKNPSLDGDVEACMQVCRVSSKL